MAFRDRSRRKNPNRPPLIAATRPQIPVITNAEHLDRRLQKGGLDVEPLGESLHRGVRSDEVPAPVDGERGKRLVGGENAIERFTDRLQLRVIERPLGERRSVSRREQQLISLPVGDLKPLGDSEERLSPGL